MSARRFFARISLGAMSSIVLNSDSRTGDSKYPVNGITLRGMEPILVYVKRKLREAGPQRWPAIAAHTGCSVHTMRKLAYNDIDNPGVVTVQPLLDLFNAVDRGEAELPTQEAA